MKADTVTIDVKEYIDDRLDAKVDNKIVAFDSALRPRFERLDSKLDEANSTLMSLHKELVAVSRQNATNLRIVLGGIAFFTGVMITYLQWKF